MFLMIDNYDSFVYNLVRYLEELDQTVSVVRNDKITVPDVMKIKNIQGIIISPGPKTPKEAGISIDLIHSFKGKIPILGICLGHQAIAEAFGGNIVRAKQPMHGMNSCISHDGNGVYLGIKSPFTGTRYHSLMVERESLPDCFTITSEADDGVIMGIRHKVYPIEGVQFHPEAECSEHGHVLLQNYINSCL